MNNKSLIGIVTTNSPHTHNEYTLTKNLCLKKLNGKFLMFCNTVSWQHLIAYFKKCGREDFECL
jgi:hypothetical protein